ncbi:MAG: aspartate aminotransferase family protein [Candidatus Koribacter versatilis]|uniref:Aspartate aminotransferase family protein n=1 Tax=Candidatus Korobacter versatilis TaxID=658062 RepID=A0A932AAM6_9BACT|nr:aspartate aminotransferase family protein [Candidatus Koribacter versatilis]
MASAKTQLDKDSLAVLRAAVDRLDAGFAALPQYEPAALDARALETILLEAAQRMQDNFPYFHPLYAGQMLKPPHPIARLAYAMAMYINPNNHALDGGRASSALEKEAVAEIAAMFGWGEFLGHLTSGGTFANLEALWVAGQLAPGKKVLASKQAHYTHSRISSVLRLEFEAVACDDLGRMDLAALEAKLKQGSVGGGVATVVATLGTTATGSVDPLPGLLDLKERYNFRLHADAAYGGYFTLAGNLGPEARAAFDRMGECDSIVIDPHKHGLQPYGCGCVLFRDASVGRFYKHDSPYTYFSSGDLHLGEITLECSRAGAAAVALWATQKLLPLEKGGEFAQRLEASRAAALALHAKLQTEPSFLPASAPELDIVTWAVRGKTASEASARARKIFEEAAKRNLHLALAELPRRFFGLGGQGTVTALRSVLMKPEHKDWVEPIAKILAEAVEKAG